MERIYLKSGTAVDSTSHPPGIVEVTAADSLQSRFFAQETAPKKGTHTSSVFQRLHQDSQTRIKLRDTRPGLPPPRPTDRSGPPIEDLLLQRHLESQLKMERLKARRDEELMKEVLPAPRINDLSRALAEKRSGSGTHSRCSLYESMVSPRQRKSVTPSLNSTVQSRRSPTIDTTLVSTKLSKYSDLILPDDSLSSVGKDDRNEDSEAPFELAEQEVAPPPPLPPPPKQKVVSVGELLEEAEPMEMPETQSVNTPRTIVSDSTVSRERAMEYQKMVKRHLELIKQKSPRG